LLNPSNTFDPQEYIQQLRELHDFFTETPTPNNLNGKIRAIPSISSSPAMWALTSSGESAFLAAHFGIGLSYAQFINPVGGPEAVRLYKERFKPSDDFPEPVTNVGIFAFCSEDESKNERARQLYGYRLLSFEKGNYDQLYSYDDIRDYQYTAADLQRLEYHRHRFLVGTPASMKEQLEKLAGTFGTEEIVIATFSETREDRLRSYELLAEATGIRPA
jgi:luciferase family oxidoreductase group 1